MEAELLLKTILKCMCGLLIPNKAEIISDKGDLIREDYLNRDIIYVSDEPIYYHNLTVQEHFWLVCKVENYTQEEAQKAIPFYTNKLHMQEYLNYYPSALSLAQLCDEYIVWGTNGIKVFSGKIDRKAVNQMIGDSYV